MSIYKDLSHVLDQQTVDKTPSEIQGILNKTQRKIGSKSIPKMIEELNKQGIKAGKTSGQWNKNAIEVEGQFFEYEGSNRGWVWRSGAANQNFLGSQPKEREWYNFRRGNPSEVDTSKLPSHEEYEEKRDKRDKYRRSFDPLEKNYAYGGNSGVTKLKDKQRMIKYYTQALEDAKKNYEKALQQYRESYEYNSKRLAEAIGEKDKFMVEFRKKFGKALRGE